jgi:hypothetical protein
VLSPLLLFVVLWLRFLLLFLLLLVVLLALTSWFVPFVLALVFSPSLLSVSPAVALLLVALSCASSLSPFLAAFGFPSLPVLVLLACFLLLQLLVAFLVLALAPGLLLPLLLALVLLAFSSFLPALLLPLAGVSSLVAAAGSSVPLSSLLSCPCSSCCPAAAGLFSCGAIASRLTFFGSGLDGSMAAKRCCKSCSSSRLICSGLFSK